MEDKFFKLDKSIITASERAMIKCADTFSELDSIAEYNSQKVLAAFIENGVSERHFTASSGYGYGDIGRDVLDKVFASCMGGEDALVRHNFVSGTHALTVAFFGLLRPNDTLLCATGAPYDTLEKVIGISGCPSGSLREFSVNYKQIERLANGGADIDGILAALDSSVKVVHIQRSRGYSTQPSLNVEQIGKIAHAVHSK
jgi:cystathionine beta-lyase family protein involved in aluminum resistance